MRSSFVGGKTLGMSQATAVDAVTPLGAKGLETVSSECVPGVGSCGARLAGMAVGVPHLRGVSGHASGRSAFEAGDQPS